MVFDWLTMAVAVRTFVRNFQSLSLSSAQFFIFEFFSLCLYVSMNCSRILFMKISVLFFQPTSPPPAATNTHTHTTTLSILRTFLPFSHPYRANNEYSSRTPWQYQNNRKDKDNAKMRRPTKLNHEIKREKTNRAKLRKNGGMLYV